MFCGFRLFALAVFASILSLPATADAPEGWKEEEKFKLLGREAYNIGDSGLLALVERVPPPAGSPEKWFKGYIDDKVAKYTLKKLMGPTGIRDAGTGPVEGGYMANAILTNEKGQTVLMTFAALIKEDAQVWQIFWDVKDVDASQTHILTALDFLSAGGSTDPALEKPKDINQILSALGSKAPKSKAAKPKIAEPDTEPKPYVAEPGQGVRNDELRGVIYDFGKRTMKTVYTNDMPFRIPSWSGARVYVVFKDGWAYRGPSVPPTDLNVTESRRVEPKKWIRWDDVKLHAPTAMMRPLDKGKRIDISVTRPSTSSSSRTSVRTSWRNLTLTSKGRFETGSTSISSKQTGLDSSMGPTSNTVSSSNKDGTFSSVSGSYIAGGGMLRTQGTRRQSGSKGNHSGAYFINGNTIELRYDDGTITRAVFGFNGEGQIIFGGTNYWK